MCTILQDLAERFKIKANKTLNDNKTRRQLRIDHVLNLNTFVILKECRVTGSVNNSKVIVR